VTVEARQYTKAKCVIMMMMMMMMNVTRGTMDRHSADRWDWATHSDSTLAAATIHLTVIDVYECSVATASVYTSFTNITCQRHTDCHIADC